jgi:hypothetical protein
MTNLSTFRRGGVDRADRRVAVDGVRACRIAAAGTRRPDDDVETADEVGQLGEVETRDVGHHGMRTRRRHVVDVVRGADDRADLVAGPSEQRLGLQRHLAVSADDEDACHGSSVRGAAYAGTMTATTALVLVANAADGSSRPSVSPTAHWSASP